MEVNLFQEDVVIFREVVKIISSIREVEVIVQNKSSSIVVITNLEAEVLILNSQGAGDKKDMVVMMIKMKLTILI